MKSTFTFFLLLFWAAGQAMAQQTVTGKVTDGNTGESLPGVSIVVKGTSSGTTTDADGNYSFKVSDTNVELVFSYIGYLPQTIALNGRSEASVKLLADLKTLEEVVVIGYGEMRKRDVAGAIVSVKAEELTKVPTTNVMESLQGKLPGVDITRSSGAAGSGVNITIRGNRSITANNSPLFVVDGIIYENIQDLNPNDIQSMEVLKDASTTAIYGSRGANGVIIVTTKRGSDNKTRVSFNAYTGVSDVLYPEVNNGAQYTALKREANRLSGKWASPDDDADIFSDFERSQIQNQRSTNWQNLFLGKGSQQDYQVGISGGNAKTRIYVSFDYFKENGLFKMDNLERYTGRINVDHSIRDNLKVGLQSQSTYYNQNNRRDPMNNANKLSPLQEPYDEDGKLIFLIDNRTANPLSDEQPNRYRNNQRTFRQFSSLFVDWKILPALSFRSNLGITLGNSRQGIYYAAETVDGLTMTPSPRASYGTSLSSNILWENILTFSKVFGNHSLTVTGVTSLWPTSGETSVASGANQLLDSQLYFGLSNAPTIINPSSGYTATKLVSFTGRVIYSFKGKYIFTATGRTDGASQLAAGRKWASFPSVSAAWRVIDEEFMKSQTLFTDLKLRAGYGVAGTAAVGAYSSESTLRRIPFSFGEAPAIGNRFNPRIGNPFLGWELSSTINVGLDFGLLKNRITGTVDVYDTKTRDLLLEQQLPATSGVASVINNIGKTRNRGIEIGINAVAIDNGALKWNVGANWFSNKEEITELVTGSNDLINGWFIGYPTRAFFDYEKVGIWQTSEEDEAKKYNQKPGDIKVKDQNNDGVIDPRNDRVVIGTPRPKWNANLSSDVSYKGFDLSLQFFARVGQMMDYEYMDIYDPQGIENSAVQNYWTPENPSNDFPRPDATKSRNSTLFFSTVRYKDASFVKLRGITLGYTMPASIIGKIGLAKARFYVTGRNVYTISSVDNYDPERGGSMSNPIPRLWVGGVNLEF